MTVDRIAFTKTFPVGMTWEKVMMEAEVWDNDDPKKCLEELKREVEEFHKLANPQLYPNGKEAVVDKFWDKVVFNQDNDDDQYQTVNGLRIPQAYAKEKVINLQDEREYIKVEKEIEECKTIEELGEWKMKRGTIPPDLMPAYQTKIKSLTNELLKNKI